MTGVNGRWSFDGAAVCPKGNVLKTLLIYNYGLAEEETAIVEGIILNWGNNTISARVSPL